MSDELQTADIERYFKIMAGLAEWETYVKAPPTIEAGTLLGADVAAGFEDVADIVWYGIVTAVDHLLLIRDAGVDRVPARALSVPTAARGALLSGCRTVWILSAPTDKERRERALGIAAEDLKKGTQAVKAMERFFPGDTDITQRLHEMTAASADLETRANDAGLTLKRRTDTDMIAETAKFLSTHVGEVHGALVLSWSTQSGYAHGYRWAGSSAATEPSVSEVVSNVAAGALATNYAIRTFKEAIAPPS
jgi:hypothetical protein